jgi:hypothetical protein
LRADPAGEVPALPLGPAESLTELAEVVAVGFPFGRELALDAKEYPAVSVNAGSITSLRRKAGELDLVQLDVALTYGHSGGPVLDDRGRVVGVVRGGVPGTGVNMAVPVTHLAKLLAAPDVSLAPPELTADDLDKPAQFKARVAVLVPGGPEPEVRLVLQAGDEKPREFPMTKQDGAFVATAVPVGRAAGPVRPEVSARFGSGIVAGAADDVEFGVGAKPVRLSAVRRIEFQPKPRVVLADGRTVMEGEITGLKTVAVTVGGQRLTLDLSGAEVQVHQAAAVSVVTATVVATAGGKEVARVTTPVAVRGAGRAPAADPSAAAGLDAVIVGLPGSGCPGRAGWSGGAWPPSSARRTCHTWASSRTSLWATLPPGRSWWTASSSTRSRSSHWPSRTPTTSGRRAIAPGPPRKAPSPRPRTGRRSGAGARTSPPPKW